MWLTQLSAFSSNAVGTSSWLSVPMRNDTMNRPNTVAVIARKRPPLHAHRCHSDQALAATLQCRAQRQRPSGTHGVSGSNMS